MAMIFVFRQLAEVPPFRTDRSLPPQILDQIGQENLLTTRHLGDVLLDLPAEKYAPLLATLPRHEVPFLATVITGCTKTKYPLNGYMSIAIYRAVRQT